ncbi:DUF1758 domain-containing protein [Nephila pilipes]|uniref:DUF1758 domain-containing protein n=1 Tax=Nephila pilipes TaxID=299642 RepID=A0A8X6U0N5_NEPPI|nr:DUF1758 domain-containing protein [Nephila pilipes]
MRAILDSGPSFITTEAANALGLQKERVIIPISVLNDFSFNIKSQIAFQLSNSDNDFNRNIELLVVPKITDFMSLISLNVSSLRISKGINLADPEFCKLKMIDILLGAELFFLLLMIDKLRSEDN